VVVLEKKYPAGKEWLLLGVLRLLGVFWWQKRGEFVVECVVIVVFCVVISESLKTRQLFELYFLAFPFWESTLTRIHTPGAKAPVVDAIRDPRLKPWGT
jgi:hypothetical protein